MCAAKGSAQIIEGGFYMINEISFLHSISSDSLVTILVQCSPRGRIAVGATCQKIHELVSGKLSCSETSRLWSDKLKLLNERSAWGICPTPATVKAMFQNLNLFVIALIGSPEMKLTKPLTNFCGLDFAGWLGESVFSASGGKWNSNSPLMQSYFSASLKASSNESWIREKIKRAADLEWITINRIWPQIKEEQSPEKIREWAAKVYPHARNSSGEGLLHLAVLADKVELVKALIEVGHLPLEQLTADKHLNSPLLLATQNRNLNLLNILIEEYDANMYYQNKKMQTVLSIALEKDYIDVLDLLIKNGIDLHSCKEWHNALIISSENGAIAMVQVLLKANINLNTVNAQGQTALMLACAKGHTLIVKLLLESGANVLMVNAMGKTALMIACEHSYLKIVQLLLDHGAAQTINLLDKEDRSALLYAARKIQLTDLLLSHGASAAL